MRTNEIKNQIELIKANIENLNHEIKEKQSEIDNFELDSDDFEDQYCEMLDDCYEEFMGQYSPSYTLKMVDPIAYRCGLNDYVDSLDKTDSLDYQELESELEDLESDLEDMESELEDLENGEGK